MLKSSFSGSNKTFLVLCHLARRLRDIMFFMGEKLPILQ